MVRKVVMNLDLSKASGPYCLSVVVVKQIKESGCKGTFLHIS